MTFNDIREFKLLPIHRLAIHDSTIDETIDFIGAEQDSTYSCNPILRSHYLGGKRQLGNLFECTFIPAQSNVDQMLNALTPFVNHDVQAFLELRAVAEQPNGSLGYIDLGTRASVTYSFNKGEMRPRLSIVINAFLPVSNPILAGAPW